MTQTAKQYLEKLDKRDTNWTEDDFSICEALEEYAQIKNAGYIEALSEIAETPGTVNAADAKGFIKIAKEALKK